ncbi:FimV/HubP family polar landmark protein [Viridibacterium curvum]|uniref:LysM domain-containing protein n=1 Tax=Viridibacterium curvum TaxID=1101404 RepID=A0ABP9QG67_9RHOO
MIASISGPAMAAGLGRINVFSSLGQPLKAEVEIAATPEELEAMTARLASAEAHARANIEFVSDFTAVRMSIERRANGSAVVRITSDRAFNEPFVDMLVELTWQGGRILREYTFLLDPSETGASSARAVPQLAEPAVRVDAAPAARPAPTPAPAVVSSAPAPAASKAARPAAEKPAAAAPAPKPENAPAGSAGDYTVKSGDSATSIAGKLKPVEVTRDQMVAALYQANKDSFGGGNINRLSTGTVLRVPSAAEAAAIDKAEARQIIVKASNFEALKSDVARAAEQAPARDAKPAQASSGKVSPKVEEKAPASGQARDQLKIGRTDTKEGAGGDAKSASRIKALEEDVVARDKALKEAKSRAAELERNVKELEKLVKMKTDSLAELQKQAAAADAKAKEALKAAAANASKEDKAAAAAAEKAAKVAAAAAEKAAKEEAAAAAKAAKAAEKAAKEKAAADEKAAKEKAAAEAKAAKEKAAADAKAAKEQAAADAKAAKEKAIADEKAAKEQAAAAAKAAEEQAAAEKAAKEQAAAQAAAEASAAAAAAATASEPVVAAASEAVPAPVASAPVVAPTPAPATDTAQVVEDSGSIFTSPLILGVLAAAAGGLGFVFLRNRRRNAASGAMTTSLSESSTSPNSVFGNAGGQTVDTGTSMLHTDFSQSGLSAIDSDEGVDPVAEADVYMAYGRDAQAEEILQDALKSDPTRVAIYLKLLEIYAQRRSVKQFENVATDLYTQTGGVGDDWGKAAALGARLDPGNPLYGNAGSTDNTTVIIPKAQAAEVPVEISLPAEVAAAPEPAPQAAVSFGTNNVSQMRATWTVPGEIGQLAQGEGDVPVMPEPEPEPMLTATSPEPLNLDFNLDLELPQGDEPETRIEAREPEDEPLSIDTQPDFSAGESAPLEFDLDVEPAAAAPAPAPAAPVVSQFAAAEAAVDKAMSELSSTDAMGVERAMERSHVSEVDLEKTNFESSLLDFDFELGEDSNVSRSSMDLSDIQISSSASPAAAQVEMVDTSAASTPAIGNVDLNDEVSTKLELARAYEEMGDIEGAKELLEEVMSDGADVQKEMARTILTRIA